MFRIYEGISHNLMLGNDDKVLRCLGIHPYPHERLSLPFYFLYKSLTGENVFAKKKPKILNHYEDISPHVLYDFDTILSDFEQNFKQSKNLKNYTNKFFENHNLLQLAFNRFGFPQGELGFKKSGRDVHFGKLDSSNNLVQPLVVLNSSDIKRLSDDLYEVNKKTKYMNYQIEKFDCLEKKLGNK